MEKPETTMIIQIESDLPTPTIYVNNALPFFVNEEVLLMEPPCEPNNLTNTITIHPLHRVIHTLHNHIQTSVCVCILLSGCIFFLIYGGIEFHFYSNNN